MLHARQAFSFNALAVRAKLSTEIATVRGEARAGRRRWTYNDVRRLNNAYPPRKCYDDILARTKGVDFVDAEEHPFDDETESAVADAVDADAEEEADASSEDSEDSAVADVPADVDDMPVENASSEARDQYIIRNALSPAPNDQMQQSTELVAVLQAAQASLPQAGAMTACNKLQSDS